MAVFGPSLRRDFILILARYIHERWPAVAGDSMSLAAVQEHVSASLERGIQLGFRDRAHLTTWVEWEAEFGPEFYQADTWEWCQTLLHGDLDPAICLYRIGNRIDLLRERGVL